MDLLLIPANIVMFAWAFYVSLHKMLEEPVRRMFRLPAVFISGYILAVYLLAVFGVIPEGDIRRYMRWFQLVIAGYIILEANDG